MKKTKKTKKQNKYWFKRRRYGYGWTPVTWQGILIVISFVVLVIDGAFWVYGSYSNFVLWAYLNFVIAAVALLLIIALKKGPSPKWRWGKKKGDKPKEDF